MITEDILKHDPNSHKTMYDVITIHLTTKKLLTR